LSLASNSRVIHSIRSPEFDSETDKYSRSVEELIGSGDVAIENLELNVRESPRDLGQQESR